MQNRMHLIQMLIHSPITHSIMGWTHPQDGQLAGMAGFAYWQQLAQTLERGCFDGVFFADAPAVHDQYEDGPWVSIRHGVGWPTHDPMPLVAAMAAATKRLGFGVTLSVSGTPPYLAVRRLSTLDYLSGGRLGWNVVTGHVRAEHQAIGAEPRGHDERYDYADEYMEICERLWSGVHDGALVLDRDSGVFADPSRVDLIDYEGKFLKCKAVPPAFPSRQGKPVIFQAGSSGRGMAFAVKHAEAVFGIQTSLESMQRFMGSLGAVAAQEGRQGTVPVVFGFQPVLGGTEEEARRRRDEIVEKVPMPAALTRMSGSLGIDLSKLDPDKPLEDADTSASQGLLAAMAAMTGGKRRTLREFAAATALGVTYSCVGTPEQVADDLERLWRGTGCHGFNISPNLNPGSVNDFVDHVVPILQKRGIFRTEYEHDTFRANFMN